MGKRKKKSFKSKNQAEDPSKKVKTDSKDPNYLEYLYKNEAFEQYYKHIFKPYFQDNQKEYDDFMKILPEKLPVVFRINNTVPNYNNFLSKIKNPEWITDSTIKTEETKEDPSIKSLFFKPISWYPNELVWELNLDKTKLKKTPMLEKLHQSIQKASDSGLITRQELVSMIPPLLLDIQSTDIVLDMCAAPGSKTAQLLEILYGDESKGNGLTHGGVLANDADYSRAYMLIHQIQRISTNGIMVVNHNAQYFPTLYLTEKEKDKNSVEPGKYDQKFYFDKILADVPCSGDGAIRKLPNKWRNWHTQDSMSLHALQIQLLLRGLNMVKIGGLLLYSTCSINPIEDEAVLTEVFRKCCNGCFELIDVHSLLPGLKGRKGLITWEVWDKITKNKSETSEKKENEKEEHFRKYFSYQDFSKLELKEKTFIKPSMFPENEDYMKNVIQIQKAMRVLPHDQNSGGFFVALFKKLKPIVFAKANPSLIKNLEEETKEEKMDEEITNILEKLNKETDEKEIKKPAKKKAYPSQKPDKKIKIEYLNIDPKEWEWIKNYYGISNDFPYEQLIYSSEAGPKKVFFVSKGIKSLLDIDRKGLLNKINLGSKIFVRNKESFAENNCPYRICQDSISALFPFMSKRKVFAKLEDFKFFLEKKNFRHDQIPNKELCKELDNLLPGSFVFVLENNGVIDLLVCQNFQKTCTIMCSKELYGSFFLKYF